VSHREGLSRNGVGSFATVTVAGPLDDIARARARDLQVELGPVSLQEFVIRSSGDMREWISA
jgi:ABC-2 type transport system ATP-binding protein